MMYRPGVTLLPMGIFIIRMPLACVIIPVPADDDVVPLIAYEPEDVPLFHTCHVSEPELAELNTDELVASAL